VASDTWRWPVCRRSSVHGGATPLAPRAPHFTPKAKRVIFLYMQGAPSQHETFDYNPELEAASKSGNVMNSAYKFVQCGQSGLPISELFPNLGKQADELCLLNGMHTDSPAHPQATIELHTGSFNSCVRRWAPGWSTG